MIAIGRERISFSVASILYYIDDIVVGDMSIIRVFLRSICGFLYSFFSKPLNFKPYTLHTAQKVHSFHIADIDWMEHVNLLQQRINHFYCDYKYQPSLREIHSILHCLCSRMTRICGFFCVCWFYLIYLDPVYSPLYSNEYFYWVLGSIIS